MASEEVASRLRLHVDPTNAGHCSLFQLLFGATLGWTGVFSRSELAQTTGRHQVARVMTQSKCFLSARPNRRACNSSLTSRDALDSLAAARAQTWVKYNFY